MDINITMSTDDNYCMHASSLIMSIMENAGEDYYKFYIFHSETGLSKKNRGYLKSYFKNKNCSLIFKTIGKNVFSNIKCVIEHVSEAANYRIASFDMIPEDRVIYLDLDMIVLSDIKELFNFKLKGSPVGAVQDYIFGLSEKKSYFNSGVLLVDLKKWRDGGYSKKVIDYLYENDGMLSLMDQDALNYVLKDKWIKLPLKFNRQKILYEMKGKDMGITEELRKELINKPVIIHYTGPIKPWHFRYVFPDKKKYLKYIRKTKWKNEINKDFSFKNCLFFLCRYMTYVLMLRRKFGDKLYTASKILR